MPRIINMSTATVPWVMTALLSLTPLAGQGVPVADDAKIAAVISRYQEALNASSTDQAMALYAEDGVLMPPYAASVAGKAQLRQTYEAGSKVFALHVKFTVREIARVSPEWAFVRTNSAGTMKIVATGATNPEANQELFILHKDYRGEWKIARYSFSSTIPPHP
jgi:uncharacterized protein (TIGR02246 family)